MTMPLHTQTVSCRQNKSTETQADNMSNSNNKREKNDQTLCEQNYSRVYNYGTTADNAYQTKEIEKKNCSLHRKYFVVDKKPPNFKCCWVFPLVRRVEFECFARP